MGYHFNQHPVVPGHGEVDLSVEELHYASDLLGNTTHQPMEQTNYVCCMKILPSLNIASELKSRCIFYAYHHMNYYIKINHAILNLISILYYEFKLNIKKLT